MNKTFTVNSICRNPTAAVPATVRRLQMKIIVACISKLRINNYTIPSIDCAADNTDTTKIKLIFLPPYSPNLNLIERYWKFFKKKILNNRYYETFGEFKRACESFFRKRKKYLPELQMLLTENFHIQAA
jgi:transposase